MINVILVKSVIIYYELSRYNFVVLPTGICPCSSRRLRPITCTIIRQTPPLNYVAPYLQQPVGLRSKPSL